MSKPNLLDKLSIYASANLSSDDLNTLILLYQPLIGAHSIVIYLSFISLLEKKLSSKKIFHKDFLDIVNLDIDNFLLSREKLEAIGLLKVLKNEEEFVYLIRMPLSPKQFLNDGLLGVYLYSKVGENQFRFLYEKFTIHDVIKDDFHDITKSFDDVFTHKIDENQRVNMDGYLIDHKNNNKLKLSSFTFSFNIFLDLLTKNILDRRKVTKKLEDFVNRIAFIYNFSELEMQKIYIDSINNNGEIAYPLFSKNARKYYEYKNNQKAPNLEVKDQEKSELAKVLEHTNPILLIEQITGMKPQISDLRNLENLINNLEIETGTMNALILYLLKKKDSLPSYNYLEKVAKDWLSKEINTTEKAIKFLTREDLKTENTFPTKNYYNKNFQNEKEEKNPKWLDEYIHVVKEGVKKL